MRACCSISRYSSKEPSKMVKDPGLPAPPRAPHLASPSAVGRAAPKVAVGPTERRRTAAAPATRGPACRVRVTVPMALDIRGPLCPAHRAGSRVA